ncbi:translation initiation factor IF-2-like isoform X1 [Triticum dicoccoides]|uniref:translation initiation factor IF-2-like isoform X1 n=1 Tax=Triticum dicoccoides TaxID=85692 RepID=UPI00188FAEAB|nr:translation initiation factor IF-2-like isoform X1 [Triticum dicoccoides]
MRPAVKFSLDQERVAVSCPRTEHFILSFFLAIPSPIVFRSQQITSSAAGHGDAVGGRAPEAAGRDEDGRGEAGGRAPDGGAAGDGHRAGGDGRGGPLPQARPLLRQGLRLLPLHLRHATPRAGRPRARQQAQPRPVPPRRPPRPGLPRPRRRRRQAHPRAPPARRRHPRAPRQEARRAAQGLLGPREPWWRHGGVAQGRQAHRALLRGEDARQGAPLAGAQLGVFRQEEHQRHAEVGDTQPELRRRPRRPPSAAQQDPQEPLGTREELHELHGRAHDEQEAQGGGALLAGLRRRRRQHRHVLQAAALVVGRPRARAGEAQLPRQGGHGAAGAGAEGGAGGAAQRVGDGQRRQDLQDVRRREQGGEAGRARGLLRRLPQLPPGGRAGRGRHRVHPGGHLHGRCGHQRRARRGDAGAERAAGDRAEQGHDAGEAAGPARVRRRVQVGVLRAGHAPGPFVAAGRRRRPELQRQQEVPRDARRRRRRQEQEVVRSCRSSSGGGGAVASGVVAEDGEADAGGGRGLVHGVPGGGAGGRAEEEAHEQQWEAGGDGGAELPAVAGAARDQLGGDGAERRREPEGRAPQGGRHRQEA